MNQYPIEVLCYFAGIMDGEGSISIRRAKSQAKNHEYQYRAYLQIGMTSREVLDWVKENIGGSYSKGTNDSVIAKAAYNWTMNPIDGAKVLEQILPYLVLKKRQALVFIEYAKTVSLRGSYGKKGLPTEINEERERLYQIMHKLNLKGNPDADLS